MRHLRAALLVVFAAVVLPTAAEAQKAVLVVRHAENDGDKLTTAGLKRARRLEETLRGAGVSAIFSTDTKRTTGTVTPLSEALKLKIAIYDTGSGSAVDSTALVRQLAAEHRDDIVLVVGHSNTIPDLLKRLGCPGEVTIGAKAHDDLFVVVPRGNAPASLVRLKY